MDVDIVKGNFKGSTIIKMDRTSSCLSFLNFKKGEVKMFFKFVLLGIVFVVVLLVLDVFLPEIKLKTKLHKELKEKKKRQKAFRKKMKELEIK